MMCTSVKKLYDWAIFIATLSFVLYDISCVCGEKTCFPFEEEYTEFVSDNGQCEWLNKSSQEDDDSFEFPWNKNFIEKIRYNIGPDETKVPQCTRIYLTDLGSEFVSDQDFMKIKVYMYESIKSCIQQGIGHTVLIVPLMREENRQVCCSLEDCAQTLLRMEKSDFVQPYNSTDLLWNKQSFANTWYNEIDYMNNTLLNLKAYFGPSPCSKNSFVFISNRLMDMNQITAEEEIPLTYQYFEEMITFYCIRMTMIIVGRPELTDQQLDGQYMNITKNLFSVIDYNCLATELTECLRPCGDENFFLCRKKNLSKCRVPDPIPRPPVNPEEKFTNDLHVIYVFALSQHLSEWSFFNVVNAVRQPIFDYLQSGKKLSIALVFPETLFDSTWIHTAEDLAEKLDVNYEKSILNVNFAEDLVNKTSKSTTRMFYLAVEKYLKFSLTLKTLLWLHQYLKLVLCSSPTLLLKTLLTQSEIMCPATFWTNLTYACIHLIKLLVTIILPILPFLSKLMPVKTQTSREKFIFFIVLISFSASILILVACTFIYRRKLVWLQKLERFRAHHQRDEQNKDSTDTVVTDIWELSWDKLLIKSEKLGSGAYGQVYRGTIIGKPPCVEHVYSNSRPNSSFEMENCDVAVKMLPRYASEAARQEFMFEIEIMKSMGYSENIVNMLGCITVGQTICLVLEFCPYKDLLNYVKIAKTDLEKISDGMRFLHSKSIIHRDLAARNILIDADRNAKVSAHSHTYSFGNSRNGKISTSGRLPIKWLAIECLKSQQFSPKSDVWSFGIVLFEMYSFGSAPFENIEPTDLLEHLEQGNRPERPECCSDEIYDVMQKCWLEKPDERATFHELLTLFTIFLERATEGYGYLCLLKTNTEHYTQLSKLALAKSFRQENTERRRSRAATDLNLTMKLFVKGGPSEDG
uniref:Protein kinase domain-containing protein n=1 Tax=Ditylenchus dipsaci TaxID=166011 RepID=A0A915EEE3_9BILA